jgi:hypothetical protein
MEETLIQSKVNANNLRPQKRLNNKILALTAVIILSIAAVIFLINRAGWNDYYQNYYTRFIEHNNIDKDSTLDTSSGWGYFLYEDKAGGRQLTVEYHKPKKNEYTFGVGVISHSLLKKQNTYFENYWTLSNDNRKYAYEMVCSVGKKGKRTYRVYINPYEPNSTTSYSVYGVLVDENGNLNFDVKDSPELSAEERATVEKLKGDILELKEIIDGYLAFDE